jgi:very-short-patch-repair endonuclease
VRVGISRTRPATAAVRAALWARTHREATYVLTATVQHGVATAEAIAEEALRVRRDRRRLLVHAVVNELLDGARAVGEIDVARELRRRGLQAPPRQVLRQDRAKRYYLDLYWPDLHLVVEIDGIHHTWADAVVGDALRQNALTLAGDTVLRVPLLGLRLHPDEFFAQIEQALFAAGWSVAA